MTTPRKTAKEISDIVVAQLELSFNQSIPLAPKAFNRVLAKICGLVYVALFQFAGFILLQMFVKYASNKEFTVGGIKLTPLQMWGDLVGIFQGTGARWEGTVTATVLNPTGTLLSGSQIVDTATEELYITIGDTPIAGATITPTVRAVNYSAAADLNIGDTLEFVSAPPQLEKVVTVASETVEGADPEDTEAFRERILQFFAARPQGGAYADYWEWGTEVQGVDNVYPYAGGTDGIPTSGPGQVDVYVKSDTGDGTASAPLLASVAANIEQTAATGLANRRPVNAFVNTVSIYLDTVDFVISGLSAPDAVATKADIETALSNYVNSRENYIVGLTVLPRQDFITSTEAGGIAGRAAAANGGTITGVSLSRSVEGGSFDVSSLLEGEQVRPGTFTWT
jgi:hypothetical protein